jgi:hypothetical protein
MAIHEKHGRNHAQRHVQDCDLEFKIVVRHEIAPKR